MIQSKHPKIHLELWHFEVTQAEAFAISCQICEEIFKHVPTGDQIIY